VGGSGVGHGVPVGDGDTAGEGAPPGAPDADGDGDPDGDADGCGPRYGREWYAPPWFAPLPNGVAYGCDGKVDFGICSSGRIGRGVSIATVPLGRAVIVEIFALSEDVIQEVIRDHFIFDRVLEFDRRLVSVRIVRR
jgi:hypothetical protein